MKWFVLHPRGNVHGVVFDDLKDTRPAIFLTREQAKLEAMFKGIREAAK